MSDQYLGEIRMFGFPRIPTGWLACNGALLSVAQYQALFSLLGTTYGGNGVTTFALPDLRGRVPIHQGKGTGLSEYPLGASAGTEQVTVLVAQLPAHSHIMAVTTTLGNSNSPSGTQLAAQSTDTPYATNATGATVVQLFGQMVQFVGGTQPHANMMPTLPVSFCIAYQGVYPTQN
ncbi:phage tail protein [Dyella sp.]|uniref:phage tail protein n=1 Tax=Dyella sp. TaxID=1869338 RepID=UPI002ED2D2AC